MMDIGGYIQVWNFHIYTRLPVEYVLSTTIVMKEEAKHKADANGENNI